eukprot:12421776-Karenia_brevis.AAC.1
MAAHGRANLAKHSWPAPPVLSGEKKSSSSWADVADEPACTNEHSDVLPLPSSDDWMNESEESHVDQWDGFGQQTLP